MNKNTCGPIKVSDQLIDISTGEILLNSTIKNRDKNFYKFWLDNLMPYMEENYTKKEILFFKLVKLMDRQNKINLTIKDMCKKVDLSDRFLRNELKELIRKDVIRKIKNGTYMLNPDVIYKSTTEHRAIALKEYYGIAESKELIQERERQKKIKDIKNKLRNLDPKEIMDIAKKEKVNDEIFTALAQKLVDGGKEI